MKRDTQQVDSPEWVGSNIHVPMGSPPRAFDHEETVTSENHITWTSPAFMYYKWCGVMQEFGQLYTERG